MMRSVWIGVLSILAINAISQSVLVQPFLQIVEQTSATIGWETDSGDDSQICIGTTVALQDTFYGSSITSGGDGRIHHVALKNLEAGTKYFYKAVTGSWESEVYHFVTPDSASAEQNFRIIAMSDMQKDGGNPFVFQNLVQDGILDYVDSVYGPELTEEIGMVMIPGDLVVTGSNWSQWRNDFFGQAHPLFSYLPLYPVLGNHEQNAQQYFDYFVLPENGTPGYEEHWWYKDYSNVRVIGLNSNSGYRIQAQLDWLSQVLTKTTADTFIDFVFVQLHHPHKSELWTPGETPYVGQVVDTLEQFTTTYGIPSIHFFGHTHGYSRGESRDHEHVWVNVATAGGAIDYWGEWPQEDYDEFVITQDEYGFVIVEVVAGADPKFTLKRISIGDEEVEKNNVIEDEITIRKSNTAPNKPYSLFPLTQDTVSPSCFTLKADGFSDADNDFHQGSQWQVATDSGGFDVPIIDQWRQHKNWYFDVNTQAGDDLTDHELNGLQGDETYWWRVRFRDGGLKWSDWSDPVSFRTSTGGLSDNLIVNSGAEEGIGNWTVEVGVIESLSAGECAGGTPYAGDKYFGVGALCEEHPFASAYQDVDVTDYATLIDIGEAQVSFGAWLADWNGTDVPAVAIEHFDSSGQLIASSDTLSAAQSTWILKEQLDSIPANTRTIRMHIMGTRNGGTDNDSYIDNIFCKVGIGASCSLYEAPGDAYGRLYVDKDAPANPDGKSWTTAYRTLVEALDSLNPGIAEIWVAEGLYKATNTTDRSLSYMINSGVELYGGFNGSESSLEQRDITSHEVILSGDIGVVTDSTDNSYHVIQVSQLSDSLVVDGFKIVNGNATGATWPNGGGVLIDSTNTGFISFRNCSFSENTAQNGGALHCGASAQLVSCIFYGNYALSEGNSVLNTSGTLQLVNTDFQSECPDCGSEIINLNNGEIIHRGATFISNE